MGLLTKLKKDLKGDKKKIQSLYNTEGTETSDNHKEGFSFAQLLRVKYLQVVLDAIEKHLHKQIDTIFKAKPH